MAFRLQPFSQSLKTLSRGYITASRTSQASSPLLTRSTRARTLQPISRVFQTRNINTELEAKEMDNSEAKGQSTQAVADWQKRAPYKIHEPNENFKARYEASCHCGKVKYQLSREEPLDSKLCHCTTCQTQHGESFLLSVPHSKHYLMLYSRSLPVGSYLPQGGYQLLPRSSRSRVVRSNREVH